MMLAATKPTTKIGPRLGACLVLGVLLLVEVGLRLSGPLTGPSILLDSKVGWVVLPDESVNWDGVEMRINSHGYRDSEWPDPVDAGGRTGLRIAVLGDSVPFGMGVSKDERCTEVLAAELQKLMPGRDLLVMNFALPGYAFAQMKTVYFDQVARWKPDLVIVALNDSSMRPMVPMGKSSWVRKLLIRSAIYHEWIEHGPTRPRGTIELGAEVQEIDQLVRKLKRDSFGPESLPHWASMEEGIAEIEQCQASHGGRVALLLLPNHTNLRDPKRKRLGNSRELLQVPDAVPVLDVYNVFREATLTSIQEPDSQGSGLFHPVDIGHPTKRGHRLLGLEMVRQLSEFPGLLHP